MCAPTDPQMVLSCNVVWHEPCRTAKVRSKRFCANHLG
jgi:hypothetical protein